MTADSLAARPLAPKPSLTRVIVAASLGNAMEWFDFLVYGYFAVTIAKVFFPTGNETASLLLTLGTFSVSFLVRPIGAIVIGAYTDRDGRKAGLTLSIMLMVIGTTMTALMPGYATIGLAAPILILVARLVSGVFGRRRVWQRGYLPCRADRLAQRLCCELAMGQHRDHGLPGVGFRDHPGQHLVASAARRMGLARPVPVRDTGRPSRPLYSPPARRNAGICRDQADPHAGARHAAATTRSNSCWRWAPR